MAEANSRTEYEYVGFAYTMNRNGTEYIRNVLVLFRHLVPALPSDAQGAPRPLRSGNKPYPEKGNHTS